MLKLRNATLADGTAADLAVGPAGVASGDCAGEEIDLGGYVLLPAPAEPHAHLDKALSAALFERQPPTLAAAIEAWHARRGLVSADDIAERAEAAALLALRRGATAIRTHVDVGDGIELRAAQALVGVRDRLADRLDIQVVAMSYPLAGEAGAANRDRMRGALELGVDLVGGAPHVESDPAGAIATALTLADEFDRPVDLHMDEHTGSEVDVRELCRQVARGFKRPVTASHCVSLGMQAATDQAAVAQAVAAAGIAVVSCPATNLHLQGRDTPAATPRGLTAVRALADAGVTVAGGGDNVQDAFFPLGCGDPLHTAALLVLAAHVDVPAAYAMVSTAARTVMGLPDAGPAPGQAADLLAVRAPSLASALATATEDRLVLRAGRVVVRTSVQAG